MGTKQTASEKEKAVEASACKADLSGFESRRHLHLLLYILLVLFETIGHDMATSDKLETDCVR